MYCNYPNGEQQLQIATKEPVIHVREDTHRHRDDLAIRQRIARLAGVREMRRAHGRATGIVDCRSGCFTGVDSSFLLEISR